MDAKCSGLKCCKFAKFSPPSIPIMPEFSAFSFPLLPPVFLNAALAEKFKHLLLSFEHRALDLSFLNRDIWTTKKLLFLDFTYILNLSHVLDNVVYKTSKSPKYWNSINSLQKQAKYIQYIFFNPRIIKLYCCLANIHEI